jgi:hypothetical protein
MPYDVAFLTNSCCRWTRDISLISSLVLFKFACNHERDLTDSLCTLSDYHVGVEVCCVVGFSTRVSLHLWAGGTFCIVVDWFCQVIILFAAAHDICSNNDLILWPQPGSDFPKELMIVPQCGLSNLVWQTSFQALLWRVLRVLFNCICDLNVVSVYFTCMHCCHWAHEMKKKTVFEGVRPVS